MSNGSTGRPGSGQAPTGRNPHGQSNGTPNGRGNARDELAGARTAAGGRPLNSPDPRTQPSANQRPAPVTSWAPKGRRPASSAQSGSARPPASAPTSNPAAQPSNGRPGAQYPAQPASAPPMSGSPGGRPQPRPEEDVPVWDPPPPRAPRVSLRERLGLGKKPKPDANAGFQRPTPLIQKPNTGADRTRADARPGAQPGAAGGGAAALGAAAAPGAAAALTPPVTAPPRTSSRPGSSKPPRTVTAPRTPPPTGVPRTAGPDSRSAAAQTIPTSAPPTTTNRAASTPGIGAPAGGATAAQIASGGPATTGGGGSAPPLYRTPAPITAPIGHPPLVAPGAPGVEPPAAVPVPGPSGAGSTGVSPEALAAGKPKAGMPRRTRKARLRLSRLDPWSVMKTSFLFSIAAGIMLVVATYAVWTVLSQSGLFPAVNEIVASVVSTPGDTTPFRIEEYINTQKVLGVAALIACVDVVIFTALATLGSFLYNLAATVLGGLEITLAED